MKIFLALISLLTINLQFETGEYVCVNNGNTYSLLLSQDSSFTYLRPGFNGTIKEMGKWRVYQDIITLYDSVGTITSKSKVEGQTIEGQNFVSIKFIDENGSPLSNLEVAINEHNLYKQTNAEGTVTFEFSELKKRRQNQPKNTVEVIEFKTPQRKTSVAIKDIFNNQITVVNDYSQTKTFRLRERSIKIDNGKLLFRNPTGMNAKQEFTFQKK